MRRRRFVRIRSLSIREWLLLAQLVVVSLAIHVALLAAPVERVAAALGRGAASERLRRFPFLSESLASGRLTTIVDLATLLTSGRHRCLPRSLLLLWLMRTRGEPVVLRIGAAKGSGGELEGHAWVEIGGRPVVDSPSHTSRFSPFLRF